MEVWFVSVRKNKRKGKSDAIVAKIVSLCIMLIITTIAAVVVIDNFPLAAFVAVFTILADFAVIVYLIENIFIKEDEASFLEVATVYATFMTLALVSFVIS
ncbi:MAG TPA: hypothetical protein ENI56_02055 [Candidatus Kaiserbacteria bacterium]|nr:hypothetical protein [Candidatus Kaiserbacteria bacterium]